MERDAYVVLNDDTFGDANSATIYIQGCSDRDNEEIREALEEMENSGECDQFCTGISTGSIPGEVVNVSDLLKLRELVADLTNDDFLNPNKMQALFDGINNLDLF